MTTITLPDLNAEIDRECSVIAALRQEITERERYVRQLQRDRDALMARKGE